MLEDEGRRVEDEGQIRWTKVEVGRAQKRFIFSWNDAFCWSRDRLLGLEDGLGNVRGGCGGCLEDVVVELAPDSLKRLAKGGRRLLPRRRAAGQSWVEHVAGILVSKLGFERCTIAPQFCWSSERLVARELHMDDIHGEINFKGGNGCETEKPYEHLKRTSIANDW